MRTLTHIRLSATRVAGLGLIMAIFGLVATTWADQMSARDLGCCDEVRCGADFSVLGLVPLTDGPDASYASAPELLVAAPVPVPTVTSEHQLGARPLRILTIAPKTSPPA